MSGPGSPRAGFSALEMLFVGVVLAIVAALVIPRLLVAPEDAKRAAAKADVDEIAGALESYRHDNGDFPTLEQGLAALVERPKSAPVPRSWKPYLKRLPKDPWRNDYQYLNPGLRGEVDVFSFGADGARGGRGINAYIGNWRS